MKKGQGLSMNVIIIAALALLVLVVLTVIFLGRVGTFGEQTADCLNKGGSCVDEAETCPTGRTAYPAWRCADENQKCCISTGA